jgi:hypothetical protein
MTKKRHHRGHYFPHYVSTVHSVLTPSTAPPPPPPATQEIAPQTKAVPKPASQGYHQTTFNGGFKQLDSDGQDSTLKKDLSLLPGAFKDTGKFYGRLAEHTKEVPVVHPFLKFAEDLTTGVGHLLGGNVKKAAQPLINAAGQAAKEGVSVKTAGEVISMFA